MVGIECINDSHLAILKRLLENGADINALDVNKRTPLHYVIMKASNLKTTKLLIDFGAQLNLKDTSGATPLSVAARNINFCFVKLLVENGADVNSGELLQKICQLFEHKNQQVYTIFKYLVYHGAEVFAQNTFGIFSPLSAILGRSQDFDYCSKKILMFLIKHSNFLYEDCSFFEGQQENKWKICLEHMAKLMALSLPIHVECYNYIKKKEHLRKYFTQCITELKRAVNTRIPNTKLKYFNLLVDNRRKLKNYAGNEDVISAFQNVRIREIFSIYGAEMETTLNKALMRRAFFDRSSIVLSNCLPIFNPNHLITRDILDCIIGMDNLLKLNAE